MKGVIGLILGFLGVICILGGLAWLFFLVHYILGIIFIGIVFYSLASVIIGEV